MFCLSKVYPKFEINNSIHKISNTHNILYFGYNKSFKGFQQGILTERERLSTADLLMKVTCFVKKVNNIFNIKRS
jgi:hypothetical protein